MWWQSDPDMIDSIYVKVQDKVFCAWLMTFQMTRIPKLCVLNSACTFIINEFYN